MGKSFTLGRLFGIQFRLHFSWFIIFIVVTTLLSWQYFPSAYTGWPWLLYWIIGIATSLLFFASVLAHELAHSLVGRAQGIPISSITLFIFGGVAQMTREATRSGAELKMAVAGPVCSLFIGGLFGLLWLLTENTIEPVAALALWLAAMNSILAVFNLIPGFPLDGGRVLRSLLWRVTGSYSRSTRIATRIGQAIGYLFIVAGLLIILLHPFGYSRAEGLWNGLWICLVGWFLENAASISYRQIRGQEAVHNSTNSQVMPPDLPVHPPPDTTTK